MNFNFNKNIINEDLKSLSQIANSYVQKRQYKNLQRFLKENPKVKFFINGYVPDWVFEKTKNNNADIDIPKGNVQSLEQNNNSRNIDFNDNIDSIPNEVNYPSIYNKFEKNIKNQKFKSLLLKVAQIHEQILDLYEYTLYEDNWTEMTNNQFEDLLSEYNKNLDQLKSELPSVEWHSEKLKSEFMRIFNEVLIEDANSWNRVYARHNNYLRYRTNRKNIILQIADIIGKLKTSKECDENAIFKYFNNRCANIQLYDNSNKADKKDFLSNWFKPNLNKIIDELRDEGLFGSGLSVDSVTISRIFHLYVKCRKLAYAIFNLMTSKSDYNGYDKWHNRFIDYCDATLADKQLEFLINAVDAENQFEEVDDYQNIMDEESWEAKGLYESWFDDSLEYYRNHKERYNKSKINKINMVPTNANQCRVTCDGKNVYANATFYPGDIIEICPTKKIDKSALYSKDMRESVFEVVPNEEWVLPYGYCKFYLSDHLGDGNCNYIWDPANRVIVIKAINKIPKYSKLLLNVQI